MPPHHLFLVVVLLLVLLSSSSVAVTPSPTPPPTTKLLSQMSSNDCKYFADLLSSTPDAASTFQSNVASGITVFCPADQATASFSPRFKNLTADAKLSLLLYHAIAVYNSLSMLKSGNGVVNTLATDGGNKNFNITIQNDGESVTIQTGIVTAKIKATVVDKEPVAVYRIDQMLEPRELFRLPEAPAPAPAPAPKKKKPVGASPPAPPGPEEAPAPAADVKVADRNAGVGDRVPWWSAAVAAAAVMSVMVMG